jgi:hypothetical protein
MARWRRATMSFSRKSGRKENPIARRATIRGWRAKLKITAIPSGPRMAKTIFQARNSSVVSESLRPAPAICFAFEAR